MTRRSVFFLCATIALIACVDNADKIKNEPINFGDTLYRTQIVAINGTDTLSRHDTIYFKPTDLTVDTSGFHYGARRGFTQNADIYNIYFRRDKVISFCDSMLNALPAYQNRGDEVVFFQRVGYEHIRQQASQNKMDEVIYADELSILLDRFSPLIVDFKNNDKPKYIIVTHEDTWYAEYKTYCVRSKLNDTAFLASVCLKLPEIQLEKSK